MHLKLRKFDPSKMAPHAVCVMIARRRAGKSSLITDLMYHQRDIPVAVVCSASEDSNHTFSQYVPDSFIYGSFDESIINRCLARQQKVMAAKESATDTRALLILDDIGYDQKALRSKAINQLFLNGRHHHISMWASLQDARMLTPCQRANTDYVFLFRDYVNKERLFKTFFVGIFPSFATFSQVFDDITADYGVLVLDQTNQSNKITDLVFHYKASVRPPFRFGAPEIWRFHQSVYRPPTAGGAAADDDGNGQKLCALTLLGMALLGSGAVAMPPAALEAHDGILRAVGTQRQVDLKGASWFGFNVGSGMVDGLWAGIDLATTTAQLRLLGFNTLRIPFDFSQLKAPAKDYRRANCARKDIVHNTLDPRHRRPGSGRRSLPLPPAAPKQVPPMPDLSPAGMCNSYVPHRGSAEDALVWLVSFLVRQGFYVVLNHHSLVSGQQIQRNPSEFAHEWGNLWWRIASAKAFEGQLKGRVFCDITNEPDFMGMRWSNQPNMIGATEMYIRVMDRLHAITPDGMLYFIEGTGQTAYGLCWGSGFVTDPALIAKHGIDDAAPFFRRLLQQPYKHQVVISPHEYGPLIRKSSILGADLVERMNASYGYLMTKGFCGAASCTKFPVVVGEFGSDMKEESDLVFLADFARWMGSQRSNSWIMWAVNANSGDTGGLVDPTLWQELRWDKLRFLTEKLGLRPWWWPTEKLTAIAGTG
ncbi:hypothetical protein OEZ85_011014 [Tetradesmus obliquus]|uniref:Glycoside hydrolase family 5 domain-containing protein n=1 Tax=Tetradesmus obliquus TaxID=3088 RepID=A0ABY8TTP2_TETOB|nr:hypothetical protein OEZ85_011014 [Tetradesmus obliquus]